SSMESQLAPEESLHLLASLGSEAGDIKTIVARLRNGSYDVAFVCLFPGQISTFFRQARSLSLKIPMTGTDVLESPSEIAPSEGAMDGTVYAFNYVSSTFEDEYKRRF